MPKDIMDVYKEKNVCEKIIYTEQYIRWKKITMKSKWKMGKM